MATEIQTAQTELEAFHQFLAEELMKGRCELTVESSVAAFRAYQRELEKAREEIRPALERSLRGESKPFDPEDIIRRGRQRLAEKGITDYAASRHRPVGDQRS